jgi:hypothetical protein
MDQQTGKKNLITVTAYAGYKAAEKPQTFIHQKREYIIKKILYQSINECLATGERTYNFRVVCQDDRERVIHYNPRTDQWHLINLPNQ